LLHDAALALDDIAAAVIVGRRLFIYLPISYIDAHYLYIACEFIAVDSLICTNRCAWRKT